MVDRIVKITLLTLATTLVFASAAAAEKRPRQAVRTLDDINIEGKIAVPQVLFITSRDYPRYRDGLRSKFRRHTLEVARSVDLPIYVRIVAKRTQYKEEGQ